MTTFSHFPPPDPSRCIQKNFKLSNPFVCPCKRNKSAKHLIINKEQAILNLNNIYEFSSNPGTFTKLGADKRALGQTDKGTNSINIFQLC